jgi:hypothetical protein
MTRKSAKGQKGQRETAGYSCGPLATPGAVTGCTAAQAAAGFRCGIKGLRAKSVKAYEDCGRAFGSRSKDTRALA